MGKKHHSSGKGWSSLKLNWAAIESFISDLEPKDDLTAEDIENATPVIIGEKGRKRTEKPVLHKKDSNDEETIPLKTVPSKPSIRKKSVIPAKERLEEIVSNIAECLPVSRANDIYPLLRVHSQWDNEEVIFWFTNKPVDLFYCPELKDYGRFVPKNSEIAIKIQTTYLGEPFDYDYYQYKRLRRSQISIANRSNFQDNSIAIAGDSIIYQFRGIVEFQKALQENHEEILDIETQISELEKQREELKVDKNTAHQRGLITKTITELQRQYRILTQQQEDLKNITIYIRKQGEMRYAPIVDVIQTRTKTQNLFDGKTVIIEGGPGTGKSTTMIHRLAYLTDLYAIDEDEKNNTLKFKLTSIQRKQFIQAIKTQRDWMFFSSSKLLKEYLSEAMRKEGLDNISEKVWNWTDYRTLVLKEHYHLLGETNAPFRACYFMETLFFQNSNIIEEFTDFYLSQFRQIKSQLPQLDKDGIVYEWTAIAMKIEEKIENSAEYNLPQFISLFNSLANLYADDCKKLLREKNELISSIASEIADFIEGNQKVKKDFEDLLDLVYEFEDKDEEESNENDEIEEENEENPNTITQDVQNPINIKAGENNKNAYQVELIKEIEKWLKDFCSSQIEDNKQMSDIHQLMSDYILPLMGDKYDNRINKITNLIIFEQFAQYAKGIKAIMLNGIPAKYKKFRYHLLQSQYEGCDLKLLRKIIQHKQGKELHYQEQSLLLGFINTLVKLILTQSKNKVKHIYIDAYNEVARPIIGIDEATDFCACDIYAMQSLLSRDFYSLTLCGDMMQRMTAHGITSWEEIKDIVPEPKKIELKTSYRQSRKVLEVARHLYEDTLHKTPNYRAFMSSGKVPEPLLFVSAQENEKIEWISKRISEVYRAYGEILPSIAIFVNDKGYIPNFINRIMGTDFFIKNNVKVLDGTVEAKSSEEHICVYPIDVVKGMEFDVVFFHNIDNSSEDTELVKRYIYVGISRAAFFLGITLNEQNPELGKYFTQNKNWFKI